ncbi:MAG: hypothetical protein ACSHX8_08225 [Opitutaceae bacterium]
MKNVSFTTAKIRPIAYFRHLVGSRRVSMAGRGLRNRAAKFGFSRIRKGPQNVDQAFQALLLNSRSK